MAKCSRLHFLGLEIAGILFSSTTHELTTSPPGQSVIIIIIITGPNENSQKASISVNVLAANRQDEVFE